MRRLLRGDTTLIFIREAFNAADGIDIDEMALAGHELYTCGAIQQR